MPVPNFQEFFVPVLTVAKDGMAHSTRSLENGSASLLRLSDAERQEMLPSGTMTVLRDRTGWAYYHLFRAGLLDRPSRGQYRITERGLQALQASPQGINQKYLRQFAEYRAFLSPKVGANYDQTGESTAISQEAETPLQRIESGVQELRVQLAQELLSTIVERSPKFFERLVLKLLVKMNYGGSERDAIITGRSGDGGIDGIVTEDRLGLERIYVQAKKWKKGSNVGTPEIRDFVGALVGQASQGVHKGVFITTSDFQPGVREYLQRVPNKIALINGVALAELCMEFDIGVVQTDPILLKILDPLFFDE